jgi:hypothetical protein
MHEIAETNMLLRERSNLPGNLKLATDEFREGWHLVRTVNAARLTKKVRACGWNFIKIGDGLLRSGVGDTRQEAIASALKLALRQVAGHYNAAEVEHIQLTRYPWFFLARVSVNPCRIQQGTAGAALMLPAAARQRRLPPDSAALYPQFGSAMPLLRQMLISSVRPEARAQ